MMMRRHINILNSYPALCLTF
ncbi:hypothetical protein MXB_2663, partial [Myxobolus squamalis]